MQQLHSPSQAAQWLRACVTGTLRSDSRQVLAGDGLLAWPGARADARAHVARAIAQGARACIVERAGAEAFAFDGQPWAGQVACMDALKAQAGPIADCYFDAPSARLSVLAVTGTNGKTSSVWWLAQALSALRLATPIACAMVGTLGVGRVVPAAAGSSSEAPVNAASGTGLTTPDAVLLQRSLGEFVEQGVQACAMEASSIGIAEHRLDGTRIHTAVFTNFTQDHLDYHGSMQAYWQAKAALFNWPGLHSAVLNIDDPHVAELAAALAQRLPDVWSVSTQAPARLRASGIEYAEQGLRFVLHEGAEQHTLQTRLIGAYNVSNLLGVVAAMRSLGVPLAAAVDACRELLPVPGRMECLRLDGQPLVAVDYAHTPDALDKALTALRPLAASSGGQLWCVFGCGGDRDPVKRPLMGAVAAGHADRVVLTSDNPRGEPAQAIVSQILLGTGAHPAVSVQIDRARAIAETLAQALSADVILVAGKGHEDYQEIAGVRRPFSDRQHVLQALQQRAVAQGVAA